MAPGLVFRDAHYPQSGRKGLMPQGDRWADEPAMDLAARRDAIRQAAGITGADPRELLDAALTELDGAIDALTARDATLKTGDGGPGGADPAERRLLHAAFQRAPVPLLMLERDGVIRRPPVQRARVSAPPSISSGLSVQFGPGGRFLSLLSW